MSTIPCGVVLNCNNSQECFAAPKGPICTNSVDANYSWKLNSKVFPPIEYIGNKAGKNHNRCELFDYTGWSSENIDWLLTFFYQNWDSNNNTTLPSGSFVRPLDNIG